MPLNLPRLVKPVKKLRKLLRKIDSDPRPDQVHDLRTNIRRFEAACEALVLEDAGVPKSVFRELDSLRKRAGKVRDMDVLTEFASAIRPKDEPECHVRLLEHLGARRQKEAAKLCAAVRRHRRKMRKKLGRAFSRITSLVREKGTAAVRSAAANATAAASRLSAELAVPTQLNKTNLHPYRLKVKELQNILLMAEAPSRPRFVEDLGDVKDAIGEWHDWEELVEIGSEVLDHDGKCFLRAELKRIAERKYEHSLGLAHKLIRSYLPTSQPKKKNATPAGVPRAPVLEAIAQLAG